MTPAKPTLSPTWRRGLALLLSYWRYGGAATILAHAQKCHNLRFSSASVERRDLLGRRQPDRYVKGRADNRLQRHFANLACASHVAGTLGEDCSLWRTARHRLGDALRNKPECFDRIVGVQGPLLYGLVLSCFDGRYQRQGRPNNVSTKNGTPSLNLASAVAALRNSLGSPWLKPANSLWPVVAGESASRHVVSKHSALQLDDGSWWTGYVFPDDAYWPDETPTWTAGAACWLPMPCSTSHRRQVCSKTSSQPRA